tara:strand:- start:15364 stop:15789 length:426 start_codon:yes stop_codon:yes gene_type:complete
MTLADKIFKISILTLLVLILGALLGILLTLYVPYDEELFLELQQDDIDDLGFIEPDDHYSYDLYTYEQLSRYLNTPLTNFNDLLIYTTNNNYELYQEGDFYSFEKEQCGFDPIRQTEICFFQILETFQEDDLVGVSQESLI